MLTPSQKLLLVGMVVLAGCLRFYRLSTIPVSLYWDEAASAYNAYSLAKTGKDEFGVKLQFLFRSFDDYKMPANIYLTALAVKIFGLNEFSARFTSALAGTLTVLATFFLVKQIFSSYQGLFSVNLIAFLSTLFLAISPWHIQF